MPNLPHPPVHEEAPQVVNLELENIVLATLMSRSLMHRVEQILTPDCFYHKHTHCIYEVIRRCYLEGRDYDYVNVTIELQQTPGNEVTPVQVVAYMEKADSANLEYHASVLRDMARRRKLWTLLVAAKPVSLTMQMPLDPELLHLSDSINEMLCDMHDRTTITLGESIAIDKDLMQQNQADPHANEGLMTGFPSIDDYGGLTQGSLTILAARPGMGKSAMALQWAIHAASDTGHRRRVVFFSFEMPHEELTSRILSTQTRIPTHVLLRKPLSDYQYQLVEYAERQLSATGATQRLLFSFQTEVRFDQIRAQILRLKHSREGLDAVFIDYFQLFSSETRRRDETEALFLARLSNDLKRLALQLKIPIIALSQLNRDGADGNARNSNLRGSGGLEEAADNILILDQPGIDGRSFTGKLSGQDTHGTASLTFSKARNAPVGHVDFLRYHGDEMRFAIIPLGDSTSQSHDNYGDLFGDQRN